MSDFLDVFHVGTSGWSYKDWVGPFYPDGTQPRDFLGVYSEAFRVVEVDSTFYAIPSQATFQGWRLRTPDDFRFCLKVPGTVTHGARGERPNVAKVLADEDGDLPRFLEHCDLLGDKLASVVFQFPYFRVKEMAAADFIARLGRTLDGLPEGVRFAVEVRNKTWITADLLDLLRERRVALVWIDHPYMPLPSAQVSEDRLTGDFVYVRLLGDRYAIEKKTKTWGSVVLDRESRLRRWAAALIELARARPLEDVYTFANNHFAGHGPETCRQLARILRETAGEEGVEGH